MAHEMIDKVLAKLSDWFLIAYNAVKQLVEKPPTLRELILIILAVFLGGLVTRFYGKKTEKQIVDLDKKLSK